MQSNPKQSKPLTALRSQTFPKGRLGNQPILHTGHVPGSEQPPSLQVPLKSLGPQRWPSKAPAAASRSRVAQLGGELLAPVSGPSHPRCTPRPRAVCQEQTAPRNGLSLRGVRAFCSKVTPPHLRKTQEFSLFCKEV